VPTAPVLTAAWDRYYANLQKMRVEIEKCPQYAESAKQRAMGFRHLMEVQPLAFNFCIGPRTEHPRVFHNTSWMTDFYSLGGPGGDFDYRVMMVDAKHDYRLTGKVNDSRMILLQVNSATPGQPGARVVANYNFQKDFKIGADGSFDIVI